MQGKLRIEEVVEFLNKNEVTITYNGKTVPKLNELPSEDKSILKKCLEWIKKARTEKEEFNKFFALWVSYNIFYDFYYWKVYQNTQRCVGEKRKISKTIGILSTQEMGTIISQSLQMISNILHDY